MTTDNKEVSLNGLAHRLVTNGLLSRELANEISQEAIRKETHFISQLIAHNILPVDEVAYTAAQDFGLPLFQLSALNPDYMVKNLIPAELILKHHALPIYVRGKNLFVAISDPTNDAALTEFKFHTNLNTNAIVVQENELKIELEKYLSDGQHDLPDLNDEALQCLGLSACDEEAESTAMDANDDLVIKYVNKIILDGIHKKSSDIHFEPYVNAYRIRYRIDGILYETAHPPANLSNRIAARLKVMSKLDISERRIPQDGHFKMVISKQRSVEFRVNSCPTVAGEKIVLRILDPATTNIGIEQLGFEAEQQEAFINAIHHPQGMVLVTGPTGSGKTVTLYTALNILNTEERNISTVEDPVELNVKGINQVSVNLKAGLSFSVALRAFLRQDPDVIMVGEIRDLETAEIGIKAAQTGHLVLSTLHTNSAAETLTRLVNMGVPTYNIPTSVHLIVAQRLARRLCQHCRKEVHYPKETLINLGLKEEQLKSVFFEPVGCDQCTNGYYGRIGIYEVLSVSDSIGRIIMAGGNSVDIFDQSRKEGMKTLFESGINKALQGFTSLAEINRITRD